MITTKIYDNGWFRVSGMTRNSRKTSHYFFNDKPIHVLSSGVFKQVVEFDKRYSNLSHKCKLCLNILKAYSTIGLENRLV